MDIQRAGRYSGLPAVLVLVGCTPEARHSALLLSAPPLNYCARSGETLSESKSPDHSGPFRAQAALRVIHTGIFFKQNHQ